MGLLPARMALCLHLAIEVPAAANFLLRPSSTLSAPQPAAHGIIRQYALLLLCTNAMVASVLFAVGRNEPTKTIMASVTGPLALYHLGPFVRAMARIRNGALRPAAAAALGGPHLHAVLHAVCGLMLAAAFVTTV